MRSRCTLSSRRWRRTSAAFAQKCKSIYVDLREIDARHDTIQRQVDEQQARRLGERERTWGCLLLPVASKNTSTPSSRPSTAPQRRDYS